MEYSYALGRRKTSVVTVRLFNESGKNLFNDKEFEQIYTSKSDKAIILAPFLATDLNPMEFYFTAKSAGGGRYSQLEALGLAISRAIIKKYPEKKKALKDQLLLTRDSRMVERKKPGLRKARKAEQYSKR